MSSPTPFIFFSPPLLLGHISIKMNLLTVKKKLIVVASIHQPSSATFELFDKLLLLSRGKTHYFGPVDEVRKHYQGLGVEVPLHVNTAEWLLGMVSTDFAEDKEEAERRLEEGSRVWEGSERGRRLRGLVEGITNGEKGREGGKGEFEDGEMKKKTPGVASVIMTLVHRNLVKSYRDVVVYGIRLAMYTGKWDLTTYLLYWGYVTDEL